jgi:hypothetical protein
MPYVNDIKLSNKITRILNNYSTDVAIRKISNLEVKEDVYIGSNRAKRIAVKYNKYKR